MTLAPSVVAVKGTDKGKEESSTVVSTSGDNVEYAESSIDCNVELIAI